MVITYPLLLWRILASPCDPSSSIYCLSYHLNRLRSNDGKHCSATVLSEISNWKYVWYKQSLYNTTSMLGSIGIDRSKVNHIYLNIHVYNGLFQMRPSVTLLHFFCKQGKLHFCDLNALFVIFEKSNNIWNCRLLQIVGGALRVKRRFWEPKTHA